MPRDITKIRPVSIPQSDKHLPVKGWQLIPELYTSIFIAAASGASGKTTLLHHLLLQSTIKGNHVWVFSPTHDTDPIMMDLCDKLTRKGCYVHCFDDIIQNGVNMLESLLQSIKEEENKPPQEDKDPVVNTGLIGAGDGSFLQFTPPEPQPVVKKRKPAKPKWRTVKHHILLDDLPRNSLNETKYGAVENLVRKNRHFKARVYISSQFILAISPSAMSNISHFLIGKFYSEEHMKRLYNRLQLSITFPEFYSLYKEIMLKKPYSFMHISRDGSIRVNFDKPLQLTVFHQ